MKTNPRIDRLTREALGDAKADDISASVASIDVMVVALLVVIAVAAVFSIDPAATPMPPAQARNIEGFMEVGNSRPVPDEPASGSVRKSDDSGS